MIYFQSLTRFHKTIKLIRAIIVASIWSFSVAVFAQVEGSEPAPINLYLPVNSFNQQELTDSLNVILKKNGLSNIKIVFADHWHEFQQRLRNGQFGMYWAPPHFAAWAINKNNFIPLIRVAEPISYVIAAKRSQPEFFELNDLIGKTVCMQSPLNLDYLTSSEVFNSLLGAIKAKFVSEVAVQMTAKQTECQGFVVSNHILQKMLSEGNDDYIRLYQGARYNNYVLLAHPAINKTVTDALNSLLIQTQTQQRLHPLFRLFANEIKLISAKKNDYPQSYLDELSKHWK